MNSWTWEKGPVDTATDRSGKWMLFFDPDQVESAWESIARETARGQLGYAAKRATETNDNGAFLVCVYTADYADERDVGRVLVALRALGHGGTLSYKEDSATGADLYGKGAALFVAPTGSGRYAQRRPPAIPLCASCGQPGRGFVCISQGFLCSECAEADDHESYCDCNNG